MKTVSKRALSILLLIAMLTSMFCSVSFAAGSEPYMSSRSVSASPVIDGNLKYYQVILKATATANASNVTVSTTLDNEIANFSINNNSKYSTTAGYHIDGKTISWTLPSITQGSVYEFSFWIFLEDLSSSTSKAELVAKIPELQYKNGLSVYLGGTLNLSKLVDISQTCDGKTNDFVTEYSFYRNRDVSEAALIATYRVLEGQTIGSWVAGSNSIIVTKDLECLTVKRSVRRDRPNEVDLAERSNIIALHFYYPTFQATPEDIYSSYGSVEALGNAGPNVENFIPYTVEWKDINGNAPDGEILTAVPTIVPVVYTIALVGSTDITGTSYSPDSTDGIFEVSQDGQFSSHTKFTVASCDTDFQVLSLRYLISGTTYTATRGADLSVISYFGEHPVTPANHDFTVYSNPIKVTYDTDGQPNTPSADTDPFHNGLSIKVDPNDGLLNGDPDPFTKPLTEDESLDNPTRDHYIFLGWDVSTPAADEPDPNLAYIFTAQWEPESEDVLYKDADDGKRNNTQPVEYLDKIKVDPNEGIWNPCDELKDTVTEPKLKNTYISPVVITVPDDITLLEDPTRDGYQFLGWKKTPGTDDVKWVFTAQWQINNEDVTYKDADNNKNDNTQPVDYLDKIKVDPNEGTWRPSSVLHQTITEPVLKTKYTTPVIITVPDDIELLEDPTRPNYEFLGWKKTPGEDDIKWVFTAQWKPDNEDVVYKDADDDMNDHTQVVDYLDKIKVDPNNGTWNPSEDLKDTVIDPELKNSYKEPVVITVPDDIELLEDPKRPNYTFIGWDKTPGEGEIKWVFTAQWKPNKEDVTYKDADDNKNDNTQPVDYLDKIKVDPNNGTWNPCDELKNTVTEPKLNDTYTEPVVITVPSDITLLEDPTRDGHQFLGWKKTPGEGEIKWVFTAQWQIDNEDVTYKDVDNNKNDNTQPVDYLDKIKVDPNNGTWNPCDELKNTITEPKLNDTYTEPVIITVPDDITLLEDPTRDGHQFLGWKKTPGTGDAKWVFTAQWKPDEEDVTYKDADDNKNDHTQPVEYLDQIRVDPNNGIWTPCDYLKENITEPQLKDSYDAPVNITVPTDITLLEDPVRENYNFLGWKKVPGIGDIKWIFTAQWEEINYTLELTKVDSKDETIVLPYAVFELHHVDGENDTLVQTLTTNTEGKAYVSYLTPGSYYLKETRAPDKYNLSEEIVEFVITENKKTEIVFQNEKIIEADEVISDDHYAYIIGRPDGLVHPEANITRAEVATIFFRLLDDSVRDFYLSNTNSFSDVPADQWFNCAISTMAKMGIVTGYPDGTFRPDEFITRAEFATIASRFDSQKDITDAGFTDLEGHWAKNYINSAANRGWINGYPDGTFRPDNDITRAEAMALVNRVAKRNPKLTSDLLEDMIRWPDNLKTSEWYYFDVQEATNGHEYDRKEDGTEKWTNFLPVRDWKAFEI